MGGFWESLGSALNPVTKFRNAQDESEAERAISAQGGDPKVGSTMSPEGKAAGFLGKAFSGDTPTAQQEQPDLSETGPAVMGAGTFGAGQVMSPEVSEDPSAMPSYHDGVAVVPKDGPAMLEAGEQVVPAEHNPNIFGRIAEPVSRLMRQGEALAQPLTPEAKAIAQKRQDLDQAMAPQQPSHVMIALPIKAAPAGVDKVGQGTRPEEKRINVDEMTKPLGVKAFDEGEDAGSAFDPNKPHELVLKTPDEKVISPEESAQHDQIAAEHAQMKDEKLPPVHPEEAQMRQGISEDKKNAMQSGDMVKWGMANLADTQLDKEAKRDKETEKRGTLETASNATPQIPAPARSGVTDQKASAVKPDMRQPNTAHPAATPDMLKGAQNRAAELMAPDQPAPDIQSGFGNAAPSLSTPGEKPAMPVYTGTKRIGAGTPGESQLHSELEDREGRARAMIQSEDPEVKAEGHRLLAQIERENPYGSAANKPGVLGKAEHILGRIGEFGANMVAPGVTSVVPGSQVALNQEERKANEDINTIDKQREEAAKTELEKAQAQHAKALAGGFKSAGAFVDADGIEKAKVLNQTTGQVQTVSLGPALSTPERNAVNDLITKGMDPSAAYAQVKAQAGKPSDQEQYIQKFLKENGLEDNATNRGVALDDLSKHKQAPIQVITPEGGVKQVKGGENIPSGATSASEFGKEGSKWYTYTDPNDPNKVLYAQGRDIPAGAQRTEVEPKTFMNEARTANTVQQALNTIHQDVVKHPELWDNTKARDIMATTLEQVDREAAGLLIAGTGGHIPLPSGVGTMINTALQNGALDAKTATALKDYISDYRSAKDQAIVMQMALQGGKIGRGSQEAFKAIIDQLPSGKTPDSREAKRQMQLLQRKQDTLSSKYPDAYENYKKEKPYAEPGAVPANATHQYKDKSGKVVGYAVDGKYQAVKE